MIREFARRVYAMKAFVVGLFFLASAAVAQPAPQMPQGQNDPFKWVNYYYAIAAERMMPDQGKNVLFPKLLVQGRCTELTNPQQKKVCVALQNGCSGKLSDDEKRVCQAFKEKNAEDLYRVMQDAQLRKDMGMPEDIKSKFFNRFVKVMQFSKDYPPEECKNEKKLSDRLGCEMLAVKDSANLHQDIMSAILAYSAIVNEKKGGKACSQIKHEGIRKLCDEKPEVPLEKTLLEE